MTTLATGWQVGTRIVLDAPRVTRTTLALFAGGSGDHNEIHLDVDVARSAGMEDVFAQGMLSMAYLGRLLTDHLPQVAIRSLTSRFVAITPVGAEPTCTAEVVLLEDGVATLDLQVVLKDGTVTVAGQATVSVEGQP